jgi:hypothetical protein
MVAVQTPSCWQGNIDLAPLQEVDPELYSVCKHGCLQGKSHRRNATDVDLQFVPVDPRDNSPPFPPDATPTIVSIVALSQVPLWMFADMTWNL